MELAEYKKLAYSVEARKIMEEINNKIYETWAKKIEELDEDMAYQ